MDKEIERLTTEAYLKGYKKGYSDALENKKKEIIKTIQDFSDNIAKVLERKS